MDTTEVQPWWGRSNSAKTIEEKNDSKKDDSTKNDSKLTCFLGYILKDKPNGNEPNE